MSSVAATTEAVEVVPEKTTHITLVTYNSMWYWWELLKTGLARMQHHFAETDDPLMELAHNIYTGKLYAYVASVITDGDYENPDPMAMVVLAPTTDLGTGGRMLYIYALYAFQRPIPREVLERGRGHIEDMARTFHCKRIVAEVQDKEMLRYCRALGWFTKEQVQLIAEVE